MLFRRLLIRLICMAGLLCLSVPAGVSAQSSATILVLPVNSEVFLNNSKSINLAVFDGVEVNAFDVTVTYDPQVLTLESWEYGFYLSSLAQVYKKDEPGEFRLAATQLAKPGVSGDGILLTLVFRGSGEGLSNITITAASFSTPDGEGSKPVRENGKLTVYGPTKTPTPTPTKTLAPSATATRTITATRTLTKSATAVEEFMATRTADGMPSATSAASVTPEVPAVVTISTRPVVDKPVVPAESAYPAGEIVVTQPPPDSLKPAGDATGEGEDAAGLSAVRILDWILGGVVVLAGVVGVLIIALLVKWKSMRN